MIQRLIPRASRCPRLSVLTVAAIAALVLPSAASAVEIDTGNPELKLRWDNTLRYNLGVRAQDCDENICGNGAGAGDITAHQSDRKFAKAGNVVINRLDLLSELDVVYKTDTGFRVSGAGWYDQAYHSLTAKGDPALLAAPFGGNAYPGGTYTHDVKRWNRGPSGEFLDAFAFTRFDVAGVPINVKLGQHNIYWGESLFSLVGGVAYGQGPIDYRKAFANPGAEAKELFKPLNQASFSAALSDRLVIAGQYFLDWKASTLPDGGTYFGPADFVTAQGGTVLPGAFGGLPFEGARKPEHRSGDWGLAVKWRPEVLDGTVGFYVREFTSKLPQVVIDSATFTMFEDYRTPREKLFGVSLSKSMGGISFGADITYRKDAQIAATFGSLVDNTTDWRPRGDIFTALGNMIAYFGKSPVFDSAVLTAELNYSRLRKVTHDPFNLYYGLPANCGADGVATNHGCPTKDAWGFAMIFEPKWFQALPGTDVSMPLYIGTGLKGNSPVLFGDNQGQGSWSLGVTADVDQKYNFALKYNGFLAKHSIDVAGVGGNSNSSLGKYWDRSWVSFTFKTTF